MPDTSSVSVALVLAYMSHIPAQEGRNSPPGRFDQRGDAKIVAENIAKVANSNPIFGTPRNTASRLAVFTSYESGNRIHARGDFKDGIARSYGVVQLRGVPIEVADDPLRALETWLSIAQATEALCASNPPAERLAALASGRCDLGRMKVRARAELADRLADEVTGP